MSLPSDIRTEEERRLLARARESRSDLALSDLSANVLREVTAVEGIDFATALLYDRLCRSPQHGPFIEQLNRRWDDLVGRVRSEGISETAASCRFAVAPGAFYEEFPHTGADGRLLRQAAEMFGLRTEVIPSASTGTLCENARTILDWLRDQPDGLVVRGSPEPAQASTAGLRTGQGDLRSGRWHGQETVPQPRPIILASVSKGGSDVKLAMAEPDAAEAFRNVVAWINVCGILDGSPMVDWLLARRWRTWFYRALFRFRGYNFRLIEDLRHGRGGPLDFELNVPPHVRVIHVVGFPLTMHMTNRLSRTFRERIAEAGPNDGSILLADASRLPGRIYPVWGADHYMRPSWELRTLAAAIIELLGGELELFHVKPPFPLAV